MGMYTGLRGTVMLNEEGLKMARLGFEWSASSIESIKAFSEDPRSCFIPFGAHSYMPDCWGESFSLVTGDRWEFSCSLKNYTGTIERFASDVLPFIADAWDLEKLYEENRHSTEIKKEKNNGLYPPQPIR